MDQRTHPTFPARGTINPVLGIKASFSGEEAGSGGVGDDMV